MCGYSIISSSATVRLSRWQNAACCKISYHPHSGWFEEALPGRAINGEGFRRVMRTRHHFGLYVQVQLLLMTIFLGLWELPWDTPISCVVSVRRLHNLSGLTRCAGTGCPDF